MAVTKKGIRLFTVCLAALLWTALPLYGEAEAGDIVGVIFTGDIDYYKDIHETFARAMSRKSGVEIVLQTPVPDPMAWANAAKKLVTIGSKVIIAYGAPATLTTMKATSTIPIVFAGVYDPEAMRITGKNATGISSKVPLASTIEKLKRISGIKKLGVIFNKSEKDTILQVREIKKLESSMGFKIVLMDARQKQYAAKAGGVDALFVTTSALAMGRVSDIASAARNARISSAAIMGGGEEKGIIITAEADAKEQGSAIAEMALKVLGGENTVNIPVKSPKKINLTVNLKEASAIGLNVPGDMLGSSTRVIR
jgi:putative ABC transport system substrate-binding protein